MYKMGASFSTRRNVRRGANIVGELGILGLGSLAATKGFQAARNMRLHKMEIEAALAEQEAEYSAALYRNARFTGWQRQGRVYGRRLGYKALAAGVVGGIGAVGGYAAGHIAPLKKRPDTLHYPTDVYSDYEEYIK